MNRTHSLGGRRGTRNDDTATMLGEARFIHVPRPADEPPFRLVRFVSRCVDCGATIGGHAAGIRIEDASVRAAGEQVESLALHRASHHCGDPLIETATALEDRCFPLDALAGVPDQDSARRTDPLKPRPWWPAVSALDGRETLMPVEAALLRPPDDDRLLVREPLSTGTAAHVDAEQARRAALLEILERDAFMRAAIGRTCPRRLRPVPGFAEELRRVRERYRLEVEIFALETRTRTMTLMALMVDRTGHGPAVTCGLASGWQVEALARKATLEAWQPRVWLRDAADGGASRPESPEDVRDALARGLYWSGPERLGEISDLVTAPLEPPPGDKPAQGASELVAELADEGIEVFEVILPQPDTGLVVSRFIAPRLLPLVLDQSLIYGPSRTSPMPVVHPFI